MNLLQSDSPSGYFHLPVTSHRREAAKAMNRITKRNLSVPQREPAIERRTSSTGPGFLTGRWRTGTGRGIGMGAGGGPAAFLSLAACSSSSALDFFRHFLSSRSAIVPAEALGDLGMDIRSSAGMGNDFVQLSDTAIRRSARPHPTQKSG